MGQKKISGHARYNFKNKNKKNNIVITSHVLKDATMDIKSFNLSQINLLPEDVRRRMEIFGGERTPVFYTEELQNAHHIHFQTGPGYRLLQHHYGMESYTFSTAVFFLFF
jgi:hypothetical protein